MTTSTFTFSTFATILCVLFITGCNSEKGAASGATQSAPPPMPVNIQTVQIEKLPLRVEAVAQTESANAVDVFSRVSGKIEKQLFKEGDIIKAGAPMYQIERLPYEIPVAKAKAAVDQQKVLLAQAKTEEQRLSDLLKQKAISSREYDKAKFEVQLVSANLDASAAQLKEAELMLSYTTVYAPVDGYAGRSILKRGDLIQPQGNKLLTRVIQLDPIWVKFSLAESDFNQIVDDLSTNADSIQAQLQLADGTLYEHQGRINFTASEVNASVGTIQLRAEFKNPKMQLLPGQFARVMLTTNRTRDVVLVPQSSAMQSDQGHFVYVVDENNQAAVRPIETNGWYEGNWVVSKGLSSGDSVIIDNLLKLRPGAGVSPIASNTDEKAQ